MTFNRWNKRADHNALDIKAHFQGYGVYVATIDRPVDFLCVSRDGLMFTCEVKNEAGRNRPTKNQVTWSALCEVRGAPHFVARTTADVDEIMVQLAERQPDALSAPE